MHVGYSVGVLRGSLCPMWTVFNVAFAGAPLPCALSLERANHLERLACTGTALRIGVTDIGSIVLRPASGARGKPITLEVESWRLEGFEVILDGQPLCLLAEARPCVQVEGTVQRADTDAAAVRRVEWVLPTTAEVLEIRWIDAYR